MAFSPDMISLLSGSRRRWLVTGSAVFIRSNLVEALWASGQDAVGFDNFATGHQRNLDEVCRKLPELFKANFRFIEADIRDRSACAEAVKGVDVVLHQAALGSVPRSIA